jgi:hypothetical protein
MLDNGCHLALARELKNPYPCEHPVNIPRTNPRNAIEPLILPSYMLIVNDHHKKM